MKNFNDNNNVQICGRVVKEAEFSHEIFGEGFYKFYIAVKRLSGYCDELPVIVSERLIDIDEIKIGTVFEIDGQFSSYNQIIDGRLKLILSIFAKSIEKGYYELNLNDATLVGYICKKPVYRKTPLGREITDVLLAVNRSRKRSYYIPCILWGRNAKFGATLEVGSKLKVGGRIQAREYVKKSDDGNVIPMVAYELSVAKLSVSESDDE